MEKPGLKIKSRNRIKAGSDQSRFGRDFEIQNGCQLAEMRIELVGQRFGLQSQFFDLGNGHFAAAALVTLIDTLEKA
jgi:hypothetical protein